MKPYLENCRPEMRKVVMIRGYGDWGYPAVCTYRTKAYEDEAIGVIEAYLDSLPADSGYVRERYEFEIRTEDDERHLYRYKNGVVYDRAQ